MMKLLNQQPVKFWYSCFGVLILCTSQNMAHNVAS